MLLLATVHTSDTSEEDCAQALEIPLLHPAEVGSVTLPQNGP